MGIRGPKVGTPRSAGKMLQAKDTSGSGQEQSSVAISSAWDSNDKPGSKCKPGRAFIQSKARKVLPDGKEEVECPTGPWLDRTWLGLFTDLFLFSQS